MLETKQAWAAHLRRSRHIGDFRAWGPRRLPDSAQAVLHDLQMEKGAAAARHDRAGTSDKGRPARDTADRGATH
jgi:hypothetical protein